MIVVRWTARVLSVIIVLFHLMSFLGDLPMSSLSSEDTIKLLLWGLIMIGLIIAWKWERPGALMILIVSLVQVMLSPLLLRAIAFWIAPFTGMLYLLSSTKQKNQKHP